MALMEQMSTDHQASSPGEQLAKHRGQDRQSGRSATREDNEFIRSSQRHHSPREDDTKSRPRQSNFPGCQSSRHHPAARGVNETLQLRESGQQSRHTVERTTRWLVVHHVSHGSDIPHHCSGAQVTKNYQSENLKSARPSILTGQQVEFYHPASRNWKTRKKVPKPD
jgi:hypothetical protein